jgi:ATP-dependent protease ClpP protease subunit
VKGDIVPNSDKWVYDWLGIDAVSPGDVNKALAEANGEDIEVDINSGGGDMFSGSEIYTALRNYKGKKIIRIVGVAASAASVIAMAGESEITPTGLFMIHNVSIESQGDYRVMDHTSDVLKTANQAVANAYKDKTGLSDKELLSLMDRETWWNAEEAVKNKFIDKVMFGKEPQLLNSVGGIPHSTIEKIKNSVRKLGGKNNDPAFLLQQELDLLKLKEEITNG